MSRLATGEPRSLFLDLSTRYCSQNVCPEKVELLGGQVVRVDDLSPFLCAREAERGDHGQEDLVLHPREKPTAG